jgi:hypothetical protein
MQRISVSTILIAALLAIGVSTATLHDGAGGYGREAELTPPSHRWSQIESFREGRFTCPRAAVLGRQAHVE